LYEASDPDTMVARRTHRESIVIGEGGRGGGGGLDVCCGKTSSAFVCPQLEMGIDSEKLKLLGREREASFNSSLAGPRCHEVSCFLQKYYLGSRKHCEHC